PPLLRLEPHALDGPLHRRPRRLADEHARQPGELLGVVGLREDLDLAADAVGASAAADQEEVVGRDGGHGEHGSAGMQERTRAGMALLRAYGPGGATSPPRWAPRRRPLPRRAPRRPRPRAAGPPRAAESRLR